MKLSVCRSMTVGTVMVFPVCAQGCVSMRGWAAETPSRWQLSHPTPVQADPESYINTIWPTSPVEICMADDGSWTGERNMENPRRAMSSTSVRVNCLHSWVKVTPRNLQHLYFHMQLVLHQCGSWCGHAWDLWNGIHWPDIGPPLSMFMGSQLSLCFVKLAPSPV